jgi:hypothetical protein
VQHRSGGHRRVMATRPAPPQQPRWDLQHGSKSALRTPEPLRPSTPGQVHAAGSLIGEALPKLQQGLGKLRSHAEPDYPLGYVESTG